jgi:type II secretory pathway pseudopilin PulG
MVVVLAVILVLVALVVPAATQMWNQRAISDAENAVGGLLMTTRARAMQGSSGEMGLFFYVDSAGKQYVATIAKNPIDPDQVPPLISAPPDTYEGMLARWQTNPAWQDVFTIVGQPRAMPSTMRVVPRKVVEPGFALDANYQRILTNEDFSLTQVPGDNIDRHRNFFVMLFSTTGEPLNVNPFPPFSDPSNPPALRNVVIRDRDADLDGKGDVTGRSVSGSGESGAPAKATNLYNAMASAGGTSQPFEDVYGAAASPVPPGLVIDPPSTAMCFRTVDGLLVYDDALLREAGNDVQARLTVLQNTAQPFYVNRLTGAVVKGPQGENEATP